MCAELLALYGLGLGGAAVGHSVSSFWSWLNEPILKRIYLENSLLTGNGKVCHVIHAYHDVTKRIYFARVSVESDKFVHLEAKTKEELEQKVQDLFDSM